MADGVKISQLPDATTPLTGAEQLPLVQSGVTKRATVTQIGTVTATGSTTARTLAARFADTVNVKDFGAVGDGVTDDTVAIQAALTRASAIGAKFVVGTTSNSFLISSSLAVPANVGLFGLNLKQASGANVAELIVLGNNASLVKCVIDGNSAQQTYNSAHVVVRIGLASNCRVEQCTIYNISSYGVVTNGGYNAVIIDNIIHSFYNMGVACFDLSGAHEHIIERNNFYNIGWGAVLLQQSDGSVVRDNTITGTVIGGRTARLSVNTTVGGAVSRVSGPTFATLRVGNFLVVDSGKEYRITSITDNNNLTVDVGSGLAALTGAEASAGSGDLIGVIATSHFRVDGNLVVNTSTFGMGASLASTGTPIQCGNGSFSGNQIQYAGKNAINLNSVGDGTVENITLALNKIYNAGWSGGITASDRIAIYLVGDAGSTKNITVCDNTAISYAGAGQTTYLLGTDGSMSVGTAFASGNVALDIENDGIFNDVISVTLTSDWGSTTTVTNIVSVGDSVRFQVNTAGSIVASGLGTKLEVQKVFCSGDDPPMVAAKIINTDFAASANLWTLYGENLSVRGIWVAYSATAVAAGQSYTIQLKAA